MTERDAARFSDGVVELRVHGVGGTPPADLLHFPGDAAYAPPEQIAGDHIAGFYRRRWPKKRKRALEGYSWGGLTSRKGSRALWLLLLPFSIINAAGWLVEPRRERAPHPTEPGARPDSGDVARGARLQFALVRAIGLGITFLFVAWIAALSVDLVAFQCGGQTSCVTGRWWMSPLAIESIATYPARRMILGALVPLSLIGLVVILSFRSRNRYEAFPAPTPDGAAGGGAPDEYGRDGAGLADPEFWRSGEFVRRATYAHVGAAIATVGGLYALSVVELTSGGSDESTPFVVLFALFVALVLGGLVVSGRPLRLPDEGTHPEWHALWLVPLALTVAAFFAGWSDGPQVLDVTAAPGAEPVFSRAPLYGALVVVDLIAAMWLVRIVRWWRDPEKDLFLRVGITLPWALLVVALVWWHEIPGLRSISTLLAAGLATGGIALITWLMARHRPWRWMVAGLAGLAVAAVVAGSSTDHDALQWLGLATLAAALLPTLSAQLGRQDRWRWGAPVSGAALATVTLMVAVAGSITRMADFLDRGAEPGAPEVVTLDTYGLVALFVVGAIVATALAAALHFVRMRMDVWGPVQGDIAAEYDDQSRPEPGDEYEDCVDGAEAPGCVVRRAATWRSVASAARDVDVFLTFLALLPFGAALFAIARLATSTGADWPAMVEAIEQPSVTGDWSALVTGASWIASLAPLVGVVLVRVALRNDGARRTIGIVWDILTFWPRRFHPLGPPAYSERAVPELGRRVTQLTRHDDARLMLVGHSQGAVVAAAALAALLGEGRPIDKVTLVTHGNPTGRLYRRFFPGYFGAGMLRWIRSQLHDGGSWLNLYRLTDPIGDAVFTGPDEDLALPTPGREVGDVALLDPAERWRFSLDDCPRCMGHSHYLQQPEAITALDDIARALAAE